jgi:PAS domain S-box-containing protein
MVVVSEGKEPGQSNPAGDSSSKTSVFSWLTIIFGAVAALIGMVGIIGLYFGIPLFTSLFPGYKTIAFSAAVIWIIFGSVLAFHAQKPLSGRMQTCIAAVLAAIAIIAAFEFPLNMLGKHFLIETLLVNTGDTIFGQPTTPISPVAVVLIIPSAIALFLMLYASGQSKEHRQARNAVGTTGLVVSLVSLTFVMSYIYGAPFLYNTPLIPIGFISATAALLIGAGLVTAAGPRAIPLKYITGPSTRARLLRVFLPLTLIIILVQNFLMVTVPSYYNINNALLLSVSVVVFSIVTTYVVAKVSGTVSRAIDRAEQERKEAEDALRESEERFRTILHSMQFGIIVIDAHTHTILDANQKSLDMMGGTKETVLGSVCHRFICPAELGRCPITDLAQTIDSSERILITTRGEKIPILKSVVPTILGGKKVLIESFIDIAARKRAEEALRESEARLNAIMQGSPIPKFVIDRDHRVIFWNKALEKYSGIKAEEVVGTNQQWKAFYPNERPCMADLLVDGAIERITQWYKGKYRKSDLIDGAYEATDFFPKMGTAGTWLFFTAAPIKDSRDTIIGAVETLNDVTEVKRVEEEIRTMSQFQESIITNANVWLMVLDEKGNILLWNNAAADISGYSPDEVKGNNRIWKSLYPDRDYRKKITDTLTQIINERKFLQNFETSIKCKSGEQKVILWNTRSLEMEKGQPARFVAIGVDITKSIEAEEALRESEERYRNVVEDQTEFICRFAPDGKLTFVNDAYCRYFGLNRDECIGKRHSVVLPPDDLSLMKKHIRSLTLENPVATIRHRIIMPSGEVRWQRWSDRAIFDEQGELKEYQSVGRDITDVVKTEESLKENEGRLNAIIQGSPIPQFIIDRNHRVIKWNEALEKYSGIKAEEVIGTDQHWRAFYQQERPCMADLLVDEKLEKIPLWYSGKCARSNLIDDAYEATDYFPKIGKKGTWLHFTAAPIRDLNGAIIGAIETLEDITERKMAEEALLLSEHKYRTLVENIPEKIFVKDALLAYVSCNDSYARDLGIAAEAIAGKTDFDFHPRDLAEKYRADDRAVMESGATSTIEEPYVLNGVESWVSTLKTPIRDDAGNISGILGIFHDITERKRIEEALAQSEERYRAVVEDQTEFICRFAPDGTLTFVNDAYCRYFGLNKDRCIGSRHSVVLPVDDARQMKKHLAELTPENPVGFIEHRIIMPSGEVRWQRWSDRAIFDKDGHVVEYQSVGKDITERKKAQFQREALIKELEQKNVELERFTYTVSHDLKSPLITIRGFLGLLEEDALKADTVSLKKDLSRIKSATNKMEVLLRDLLTLSRIGRIVSPPTMVSFTMIAEDAVELLEGAIQQREVTVEIAPDMPVVNVDRDRVREAVMNLVENAIKFMGDQPHPKIEIGVRYDRDQPVFFVKDNGIGIDPQYHKKIFSLFEKLSANTEGSGTGLAIVQRIIEVHRGRIWVESAGANQGSTFYFSLPVAGADGTDTHKNEDKAEGLLWSD